MDRYSNLRQRVASWAFDKGILARATPLAQCEKTEEEVSELKWALAAQSDGKMIFRNIKGKEVGTEAEIKDAIGDILVTVLVQAELQGLDPMDCLESAVDIIEKRTGKMINGQFVKDEK